MNNARQETLVRPVTKPAVKKAASKPAAKKAAPKRGKKRTHDEAIPPAPETPDAETLAAITSFIG